MKRFIKFLLAINKKTSDFSGNANNIFFVSTGK